MDRSDDIRKGLRLLDGGLLEGFAFNRLDPGQVLTIEVLVDGIPVHAMLANEPSQELLATGAADPCHGFSWMLPPELLTTAAVLTVRLANTAERIGSIARPFPSDGRLEEALPTGRLEWTQGLTISGWLRPAPGPTPLVRISCDGDEIMLVTANRWHHLKIGGAWQGVRAFEADLPSRFADGRVHTIEAALAGGEPLAGSPTQLIAYPPPPTPPPAEHGGEDQLQRGRLLGTLLCRSTPMSMYDAWRRQYLGKPFADGASSRTAVVRIGEARADSSSSAPLEDRNAVSISLPCADGRFRFVTAALQRFVSDEAQDCQTFVFLRADTRLYDHATGHLIAALNRFPDAPGAYADYDMLDDGGRAWPFALPAFDYERVLEQGIGAELFALRREAVLAGLRCGAASLFRLLNQCCDRDGGQTPLVHVPGGLATVRPAVDARTSADLAEATAAHLEARGMARRVQPAPGALLPNVHLVGEAKSAVSLVVPIRSKPASADWLEQLLDRSARQVDDIEALIAVPADTSWGDELPRIGSRLRVVAVAGPATRAHLINAATRAASHELVGWMSQDTASVSDNLLPELLSRMLDADVGAVAPLLVHPSGLICEAGLTFAGDQPLRPPFTDRLIGDAGYGDLLLAAHQVSAASEKCLLLRQSDFAAIGGLDERNLPFHFFAADYCARLRAMDRRIVVTPRAQVRLRAGETDSSAVTATKTREYEALRARWLELTEHDPYYSPMLAFDRIPWSGLQCPPRHLEPRRAGRPVQRPLLPGW